MLDLLCYWRLGYIKRKMQKKVYIISLFFPQSIQKFIDWVSMLVFSCKNESCNFFAIRFFVNCLRSSRQSFIFQSGHVILHLLLLCFCFFLLYFYDYYFWANSNSDQPTDLIRVRILQNQSHSVMCTMILNTLQNLMMK